MKILQNNSLVEFFYDSAPQQFIWAMKVAVFCGNYKVKFDE